jgi:hypothetical protein
MLEPAAREAIVLLLRICIRRFPGGAEQASAARRQGDQFSSRRKSIPVNARRS